MKVLFISSRPDWTPDWLGPDGDPVELVRESDPSRALRRLDDPRVDAVLLDGHAELRRALARSEARFRDVIDGMADAVVVVDREGVVRYANREAIRLFGDGPESLIGAQFGYPMTVGESTEIDLHRPGRKPRIMEMRVVESEWEGRSACIATLRDITERKEAEADARNLIREQTARSAAESAARRFRILAETSTLLASSLDYPTTMAELARLCVTEVADWAIIYGPGPGGVVERVEVAHRDPSKASVARELRATPLDMDGPSPVLATVQRGESVLEREVTSARLEAIAQDEHHLELMRAMGVASYMIVPLVARGRNLGAIAFVSADPARVYDDDDLDLAREVASRAALAADNARLYHEAQEATRAKSDLLTVISHDLRTPLNSIIGYAELLIMGVPETLSEGTRERVRRIQAGARHLLELINQLLSLSRLEAGREEVRSEAVDLGELVREIGVVIEPLAADRGLELSVELPDEPVVARTDPEKVRQVLTNLTANAVKFTDEGRVTVELADGPDGAAMLRVRDTGPGIAPEDRDRIFEPFWQAGNGRAARDAGTGLGLAVVRRLVDLLGGRIELESEPGAGTTFTVTLGAASGGDGDGAGDGGGHGEAAVGSGPATAGPVRAVRVPPGPVGASQVDRYRAALESLESRYRDLIQGMADGAMVVDREGTIRFANSSAELLFRSPPGGLVGRAFGFPIAADETAEVDIVAGRNGDDGPAVAELRVVEAEWEGEPAYLVSLRDITDRRRAEARDRALAREEAARWAAEAANQAKTDFLAVMSHELRTPLAGIMGYTELLERGIGGPITDAQHRFVRRIQTSSTDLLRVIDEILDFANSEDGRLRVVRETTTLGAVVGDALRDVEPAAREAGLELNVSVTDRDAKLDTDAGKLRQILINLLSNAVKFTPAGRVELEAGADGDAAVFTVRDTGIGIPAESLEAVFEGFVQVENPLTRRYGGTGLGLTVADRFARLLGGRIEVESREGAGSAFTVRIPRRLDD